MNYSSASSYGHRLIEHVRSGTPFSMLRFGDGEAIIGRYPKHATLADVQLQVSRWWKEPVPDASQAETLKRIIIPPFQSADMLGIPSIDEQRLWPKWNIPLRFEQLMQYVGIPKADADLFYFYDLIEIDKGGALAEALLGTRSLRLIGCRPQVLDLARKRFSPVCAEMKLVRAETFRWHPYSSIDAEAMRTAHCPPHWPDGYHDVLRWIRTGGDGHTYLVGAGGLGKAYCAEAKACGSIGLDVGALFDGWIGLPTRPYLRIAK